jgi:hypothetical protein
MTPAFDCRTGLDGHWPAYVDCRAGTTTLCRSQLYPPQPGTVNLATEAISTASNFICRDSAESKYFIFMPCQWCKSEFT